MTNWGFLLAMDGTRPVEGSAVTFDTTGVFIYEGRRDLSVLWDLRSRPMYRVVGIPLFHCAAE